MKDKVFLGIVAKKKEIYGIKDSDISRVTGIKPRTLARRLKDPEQLSVRELSSIMRYLRFTAEEKAECLL